MKRSFSKYERAADDDDHAGWFEGAAADFRIIAYILVLLIVVSVAAHIAESVWRQ